MNIFGKEINFKTVLWLTLQVLIIIDIVLITIAMFFTLSPDITIISIIF